MYSMHQVLLQLANISSSIDEVKASLEKIKTQQEDTELKVEALYRHLVDTIDDV